MNQIDAPRGTGRRIGPPLMIAALLASLAIGWHGGAQAQATAEPVVPSQAAGNADGDSGDGAGSADGAATVAGEAAPMAAAGAGARDPHRGSVTNLPLPRYVSLKGAEGNARRGPSLSHRIDWVFRHAGMPLRVTAEYGHWRRVEDSDGAGGWVHYSLLSGVRTAIIEADMAGLHARADENAAVTARAERGAIVKLGSCTTGWCQVTGGGASGWLPKGQLWGVDPAETRD